MCGSRTFDMRPKKDVKVRGRESVCNLRRANGKDSHKPTDSIDRGKEREKNIWNGGEWNRTVARLVLIGPRAVLRVLTI